MKYHVGFFFNKIVKLELKLDVRSGTTFRAHTSFEAFVQYLPPKCDLEQMTGMCIKYYIPYHQSEHFYMLQLKKKQTTN